MVLNSKVDFTRPFMINLNMQRGSSNQAPGGETGVHLASKQQPHKSGSRALPQLHGHNKRSTSLSNQLSQPPSQNALRFRPHRKTFRPQTKSKPKGKPGNLSSQSYNASKSKYVEEIVEPSRPTKRRASTPINDINSKRIKFNTILSPIKEVK